MYIYNVEFNLHKNIEKCSHYLEDREIARNKITVN